MFLKICTSVHEQKYIFHVIEKGNLFAFKHKILEKYTSVIFFA